MTSYDLFRCMGDLSDELIEEAVHIRRRPRWIPLAALAACAVLAVSIPMTVRMGQGRSTVEWKTFWSADKKAADMQQNAAATEEAAAADVPAEMESLPESFCSKEEFAYDIFRQPENRKQERILSASLQGLQLGMSREKIRTMLGEPDSISNIGETKREDGIWVVCWFYNTSGHAEIRHDLSLTFTTQDPDGGDDWILSDISVFAPCAWTMDTGIGIGSSREAVLAAYPDAEISSEDQSEDQIELVCYDSGDLYLTIILENAVVNDIRIGGLNAPHFTEEMTRPDPSDPYVFTPYDTLSGSMITAYTAAEGAWEEQILTGRQAKRIVTALNMMDPEPSNVRAAAPAVWLQFESGGAAALYGENNAGAVYRLEDPAAFAAALKAGEDPSAALTLIQYCVFPDAWDDVMTAFTLSP